MSDDIKLAFYGCAAVFAWLMVVALYEGPTAVTEAPSSPARPSVTYWQPKAPGCSQGSTADRLKCARDHAVEWGLKTR